MLIRGSLVQVQSEELEYQGFMKQFIDPFLLGARLVPDFTLGVKKKELSP
jgi:hypothetical protein